MVQSHENAFGKTYFEVFNFFVNEFVVNLPENILHNRFKQCYIHDHSSIFVDGSLYNRFKGIIVTMAM